MRQMMRNIAQEEAAQIGRSYSKYLKACAEDGDRLVDPANGPIAGKRKAVEVIERYYVIQQKAEEGLNAIAANTRVKYLAQIDNLIAEAKSKGLNAQIEPMEKEKIASGTSGASFLRHLGL